MRFEEFHMHLHKIRANESKILSQYIAQYEQTAFSVEKKRQCHVDPAKEIFLIYT